MPKFNTKKYILFTAVIGLLIFLHITKILSPVESFITGALRPLLGGLYSASSSLRSAYNDQTRKKDFSAELESMGNEVNLLTAENARLKILEEENQVLREHLNFLGKDRSKHIMGNIISRGGTGNNLSQGQAIVIDKGAKDGISPGLAVVNGQGIMIGKIIAVQDYLSEVYLTVNPACRLAAVIQNQDKTSGITQGELGLAIKMEFIPQTKEIKAGDIVVTSGLEQNIPRGLVIGKVAQVNKESNELWQNAVIEPLIDLDELIIVSVLVP
ncbi:rod shape-determining protein MreC [Patescibacteria group bacterium]|nr:rod shape-determining protein MreC [Patescibacteria group bacterium]MBU4455118.1 rod shape-determining protein MreC [Patescibacteria group bacterium]